MTEWSEGTRPTTTWTAGADVSTTYVEGTRPSTDWDFHDTELEDLTIADHSFETGLDDFTITAQKTYPLASWRWGESDGSDGGECAVVVLQKAGNNYRGTVYIKPTEGNQLCYGRRYNAKADMKIWNTANVTGRLQVAYDIDSSTQQTDITSTNGWRTVTVTFIAGASPVQLYAYCIANDNNVIQEALRVDNFRIERYYGESGWTEGSAPDTTWSDEDGNEIAA
jgi:hypothetical protein